MVEVEIALRVVFGRARGQGSSVSKSSEKEVRMLRSRSICPMSTMFLFSRNQPTSRSGNQTLAGRGFQVVGRYSPWGRGENLAARLFITERAIASFVTSSRFSGSPNDVSVSKLFTELRFG